MGALSGFKRFVEHQILGGPITEYAALRSEADLEAWAAAGRHGDGDLAVFAAATLERGLHLVGRGSEAFLSSGGWETGPGQFWLAPGFFALDDPNRPAPFDAPRITEQSKHSWREGGSQAPSPPFPIDPNAEAYSWGKAPRYAGRPAETGPLARWLCAGDPLVLDLVARRGASARVRALARFHELVRLTAQLEGWLSAIDPASPFCARVEIPPSGDGLGLVEAPRGTLGHWLKVDGGRIVDYQIVTPTAWNFSPRDDADVPGPVEKALAGLTAGDEAGRDGLLLWVVKSFDPCLFCSVH
jgi:hydrogenase large subunit